VDGEIVDGASAVDESMVTGESCRSKKVGEEVIGATINKTTGAFKFRATKVSRIRRSPTSSAWYAMRRARKVPVQRIVDVVSVLHAGRGHSGDPGLHALGTFGPEPRIVYALIVAVTTLIIACPCALGMATPMSLTTGVGLGALNGILIRGGEALQTAQSLQTIILDKTGTITYGKPAITDVVTVGRIQENELLRLAASVEKSSEHPLAAAIVEGAEARNLELPGAESFNAIPGHGIEARVEGRALLLGNVKLMRDRQIVLEDLEAHAARLADEGKTPCT
jgi:Cu+-exporting ATPase